MSHSCEECDPTAEPAVLSTTMSLSSAPVVSGAGPSDAALVVAARAGERWASEALFHRYVRTVNRLAFRLMGRDVDIDDLVQESFAQALTGLGRLQEPGVFGSWLAAIVARTAYKMIRRRQLLRRVGLAGREDPIDLEATISREVPPDVAVELRRVYGELHRLPAALRVPLVLHRIEGMQLDEVAAIVGASVATVKRRIAEAENALEPAAPKGVVRKAS
jgi:RNA polymerase sigma-70 factor, ECF subfamily